MLNLFLRGQRIRGRGTILVRYQYLGSRPQAPKPGVLENAAANAAVIDHIGGMEPEESIPLAPGAAAALARDALQMGQAAPTTRPPGSAAALAREALQQAAPRGAAAALAREALQQSAVPPGAAAASARDLLQKPRPPPSAPPLPTLPPLQQHWQPPEIIDFEDDDEEEEEDYERRRCCCCFTRGHEPDDVFSRKWLKRLCFLHVVLGFALFWLLVLAVVIFPSSSTFGALRELPLRVLARCLACGLCALTALRVPLDARELNATLPKAATAKVLDVVASCWVWAALVPAFVRTYIAAVAHDQSAWMVGLLCVVSFVTDVSGVCVTWVAVTPLCLGDLLPIAAREEAMDEYVEEDDREDIIVEIGSLLTTPRGARDVV